MSDICICSRNWVHGWKNVEFELIELGEGELEKRFKNLEQEALRRFGKMTKDNIGIDVGFVCAVDTILKGLGKELGIIHRVFPDNFMDRDKWTEKAFELAGDAVSKLQLSVDIKIGHPRVAWLTHAFQNIEANKAITQSKLHD
ncbi:unnamed protein product [marine sediment metagenome]|uniref:Uncharacterized protein n=1 Tax=marine sediment metagenome TaxID=412755 RepID=X0YRZ1_9ZZZZ